MPEPAIVSHFWIMPLDAEPLAQDGKQLWYGTDDGSGSAVALDSVEPAFSMTEQRPEMNGQMPSYISILPPNARAGAWGYACGACRMRWRNFADERGASEFAALHVKGSHATDFVAEAVSSDAEPTK